MGSLSKPSVKGVLAAVGAFVFISLCGPAAQAQQCGPMDVVFVIDNTGSMTAVIAEVQKQVGKIADATQNASGGDYQFGLIALPANNVDVLLDMTPNNRQQLDAAVVKMATVGSCGAAVGYDEGMNAAINHLGPRTGTAGSQTGTFSGVWRPQATKIIIVITDTDPSGFECVRTDEEKFAIKLATDGLAQGIHTTGIYVPDGGGTDPIADPKILSDVAGAGGGFFKQSKDDASDLSDVIADIIKNCGGAAGASGTLFVNPLELALGNSETGKVTVTNFAPNKDGLRTEIRAFGQPDDFQVRFTPVTKPAIDKTEETTIDIAVGPDTPQGTYPVNIQTFREGLPSAFTYVLVFVDCHAPYILPIPGNNPANTTVPIGGRATLRVIPAGNGPFHYQWYQGHSGSTWNPVAGATSSTFLAPVVTAPTEFWVRVTNACGATDSFTATVSPQ
jgi:hypothetical protein